MTRRAQAYLRITAIRHLVTGLCVLLNPAWFSGAAFDGVRKAVPFTDSLHSWGLLFLATGTFCAFASWRRAEGAARWALLASVCTTGLCFGAFAAVALADLASPLLAIFSASLIGKDLVLCRQPMRSPFEDVAKKILANDPPRRT